jgi:type I restriction enzyme S subunit
MSVGEVSNVIRGVSYRSDQLIPSENALVTLKSILRGGGFTKNGYKPYSGDYKTTQLLNAQDVIIAFTDLTQQGEVIGRAAIVEDTVEYKNMIASMDIGVIRFKENFPFKFFIYQLLKSESFHSHILGYVNGTTVLHLSNEGPKTYKFSCPDRRNLIQFENLLSIFYSKIQYNTKEIELLTVIRDLLVPKLMSGKIRVPLEE